MILMLKINSYKVQMVILYLLKIYMLEQIIICQNRLLYVIILVQMIFDLLLRGVILEIILGEGYICDILGKQRGDMLFIIYSNKYVINLIVFV